MILCIKGILICILAFCFGATTKYADLFNEHNKKSYHHSIPFISGIAWGFFGSIAIYLNEAVALLYAALLLDWVYKIKIDYPNHSIGASMMFLSIFAFHGSFIQNNFIYLLLITISYIISGKTQDFCKIRFKSVNFLWKLHIRLFLIPLCYSFIIGNYLPFFCTLFGMLGIEIIKIYSKEKAII